MPYPSMPCGPTTPETTSQGWQPVGVFYPFGNATPYAYAFYKFKKNHLLMFISVLFCILYSLLLFSSVRV